MIEVEIKIPIAKKEEIKKNLEKMGFEKTGMVCEEDVYFDNQAGQIRKNGEALRIRKVTDLQSNQSQTVITFKGKKLDQVSMSRKELETGVEDGGICTGILEAIGFFCVSPKVVKVREEYCFEEINACVDEVKNLGDFLELEIVIPEDQKKEDALEKIEKILKQLGYTMKDTTRNSYLSMLLQIED